MRYRSGGMVGKDRANRAAKPNRTSHYCLQALGSVSFRDNGQYTRARYSSAAQCILLLLLLNLGISRAGAATYYVSPSGSDSNSGSQAAPWLTPYHAFPLLSAGDMCVIGAGVYSNPSHDVTTGGAAGTPGSPIRGTGNNAVIVDS